MAEVNQNLGHVTAYGFAKAAGYTGTAEEFGSDQANFADNAASVRADKTAAENSASLAAGYKDAAESYKDAAAISATTASTKSTEARTSAANAKTSELAAANAAANAASSTVDDVTTAIRNLFGTTVTATLVNGELIFGDESAVTVSDGVLTIA